LAGFGTKAGGGFLRTGSGSGSGSGSGAVCSAGDEVAAGTPRPRPRPGFGDVPPAAAPRPRPRAGASAKPESSASLPEPPEAESALVGGACSGCNSVGDEATRDGELGGGATRRSMPGPMDRRELTGGGATPAELGEPMPGAAVATGVTGAAVALLLLLLRPPLLLPSSEPDCVMEILDLGKADTGAGLLGCPPAAAPPVAPPAGAIVPSSVKTRGPLKAADCTRRVMSGRPRPKGLGTPPTGGVCPAPAPAPAPAGGDAVAAAVGAGRAGN